VTVAAEHRETDVVVIGGGAIGENAADRVVQGGLRCILVEKELVGGECSYWACMPSKALLRSSSVLEAAKRVAGAAEEVTGTLDVQKVLERRDSFTSNWDDSGQVEWVDGANIDLVRGVARITGERQVTVELADGGEVEIQAKQAVVLATGSRPNVPKIDGLDKVEYWGTREATSAKAVPERLVVIGGGVAAVELAQAFTRLGSKTVILARSGILSNLPKEATDLVMEALKADGIDVRTETSPERISSGDDGLKRVLLPGGEELVADELLVVTGRKPAVKGIGLEELGLDPTSLDIGDDGRVAGVDGGWLYAVGDAAGKVLLTHQGKYEARATGDAIAARAKGDLGNTVKPWSRYAMTANDAAVPQVVFTDPEIAQVGLLPQAAKDRGINVRTVDLPISVGGSSLLADGFKGWSQFVIDEDRNVLVGVTFAGQDVAELLHAATIAIVGEVPLDRLWHAVPSYPTMSEVWLRFLEAAGL
jgi:dihydrolipoamide dehydrogenase